MPNDLASSTQRTWTRLSPTALSLGIMLATIALTFKFHPWFNLILFITCMAIALIKGMPRRLWVRLLLMQLLMATSLAVTGYYYAPSGIQAGQQWHLDSASWNALQLSARTLAFGGLGVAYIASIEPVTLMESLARQAKCPRTFAYAILGVWNLFPQMVQAHQRVQWALRARGVQALPFSPLVIKLMLVKGIRTSDYLALAMLSKGFSDGPHLTEYRQYRWRIRDLLFVVGLPALFILVLILWRL